MAGRRPSAPALALVLACLAWTWTLFGVLPLGPFRPSAVFALPPTEEPFPELKDKKKGPKQAPTPLQSAAAQAAAALRDGNRVPASSDAVEFALWLYGEEGKSADRARAEKLARELAKAGLEDGAVAGLYRVAQAGGSTLGEADGGYRKRREDVERVQVLPVLPYATFMLDIFARAGVEASPSAIGEALFATGAFWQSCTRVEGSAIRVLAADGSPETLAGHTAALRVGLEVAALSGSPAYREECRMLGHEILRRFWDEAGERFRDPAPATAMGSSAPQSLRDNARAALAVWETGLVSGDALLRGRGQRALQGALSESLKDPQAVAAAGLAAGRMAGHPVEMALVGNPADPTLVSLRQTVYCLFEPSRVILNLDPGADAARFAELLYPPDLAPALFVCVETLCSPPIKEADGLAAQVREIRKLAAEAAR